jgi:ATP-dependent RNA helicase DHX37/DHR1
LHLQSSSTLGTGKVSTNKERLDKLEDKETRRAINGRGGKRKRNTDRFDILQADNDDEGDEDLEIGGSESVTVRTTVDAQVVVMDSEPRTSTAQPMASGSSAVGSALQRNPDGSVVTPRMSKKKKQGKKVNILNDWRFLN